NTRAVGKQINPAKINERLAAGSTSDKPAIVETEAELGVVLAARCECCTKKRKTQKF
ncbi:unnamed protein product, partial [marine sediment metagenome]